MQTDFTSEQVFSFVFRDATPLRRLRICSAAILVCATVIAALEPEASRELAFLWAVFHWVAHLAGGGAILIAFYFAALRAGASDLWAVAWALALMPCGVALFSLGIDTLIAFATGATERLIADYWIEGYWKELRNVALPAIGLTSIFLFAVFTAVKLALVRQAEFIKRFAKKPSLRKVFPELPASLGDDLISLSANDHYVHLRTSLGNVMLNRKFSDCVDLLSEFDGLQVHRSHWVGLKHVLKVRPNGSSYVCILQDCSEIPVSRRKYADMKLNLLNHAKNSQTKG